MTHSTLASGFKGLLERLSRDEALATEWRALTNIDPRDTTGVAQLLIAHALRANQGGIVLFFSANPKNIAANVKILTESAIAEIQIDGLKTLAARGLIVR